MGEGVDTRGDKDAGRAREAEWRRNGGGGGAGERVSKRGFKESILMRGGKASGGPRERERYSIKGPGEEASRGAGGERGKEGIRGGNTGRKARTVADRGEGGEDGTRTGVGTGAAEGQLWERQELGV